MRRRSTKGKCEGEVRRGSAKEKYEGEVRRRERGRPGQVPPPRTELPKGALEYAAEMHMSGIRFPSSCQSTPDQLQSYRGLLHTRFDNTTYCKLEVSGISLHCLSLSNYIPSTLWRLLYLLGSESDAWSLKITQKARLPQVQTLQARQSKGHRLNSYPTMWIEAEFDSSACPKIDSGRDLVVGDANTSTIPAQTAVQKPKRSWPIVVLLNQAEMQLFEESRDRKTSIVRSRSNRPPRNIRG